MMSDHWFVIGEWQKVESDEWNEMGDEDAGIWLITADGWLLIVDSLWVTFEGDGGIVWWVIGDRPQIIDEGWWLFGSRVSWMDHHIGK